MQQDTILSRPARPRSTIVFPDAAACTFVSLSQTPPVFSARLEQSIPLAPLRIKSARKSTFSLNMVAYSKLVNGWLAGKAHQVRLKSTLVDGFVACARLSNSFHQQLHGYQCLLRSNGIHLAGLGPSLLASHSVPTSNCSSNHEIKYRAVLMVRIVEPREFSFILVLPASCLLCVYLCRCVPINGNGNENDNDELMIYPSSKVNYPSPNTHQRVHHD